VKQQGQQNGKQDRITRGIPLSEQEITACIEGTFLTNNTSSKKEGRQREFKDPCMENTSFFYFGGQATVDFDRETVAIIAISILLKKGKGRSQLQGRRRTSPLDWKNDQV